MPAATRIPLLEMRGICKSFGRVQVLHGVDLTLHAGEVCALVGENGAGKSTLIKILAGAHRDQQGIIRLRGQEVRFSGPADALARGIAVIYQELALVPHLSVAENIFLGREPRRPWGACDQRAMWRAAGDLLRNRLGLELDVTRPVAELPIGIQQLVEIARALRRQANILVMDEPTSALSEAETRRLFAVIRQLRDSGVGIIYISHRLEEIYHIADRITVLRDGHCVGTAPSSELPPDRLVQLMVGRRIEQLFPHRQPPTTRELLRVDRLWLRDPAGTGWTLRDVSLNVRAGEIVGLAGLIGSGASELLGTIFGRLGPPQRGQLRLDGDPVPWPTPREALARGLVLLTNDRQTSGLVRPMSVLHNLSLATVLRCTRAGLIDSRREQELCRPAATRLGLRTPSLGAPVTALSGGNQQKVLLGRWLLTEPRVLLLDEPTRGIDVASKADIYQLLSELTAAGLGVLLITSELGELLGLADRIVVLHRGRVTAHLDRHLATAENVLHAAMGGMAPDAALGSPARTEETQ